MLFVLGCGVEGTVIDALDNQGDQQSSTLPTALVTPSLVKVTRDTRVQLDGSGSYDPAGGAVTYAWTLAERPKGSLDELTSTVSSITAIHPSEGGYYTVTLVVANGSGVAGHSASAQIEVVGTGDNHPPVSMIEYTPTDGLSNVVALEGGTSYDADGQALTYEWGLFNTPEGFTSYLQHSTSQVAYLRTDVTYAYDFLVRLVVSDGIDQDESFVTITVDINGSQVLIVDSAPE